VFCFLVCDNAANVFCKPYNFEFITNTYIVVTKPAPTDNTTDSSNSTMETTISGNSTDITDLTDATDVTDLSDSSDATDATDLSDSSDATDATDLSDSSDATDATDLSDSTDTTDATTVESTGNRFEEISSVVIGTKRPTVLKDTTLMNVLTDFIQSTTQTISYIDVLLKNLLEKRSETDPTVKLPDEIASAVSFLMNIPDAGIPLLTDSIDGICKKTQSFPHLQDCSLYYSCKAGSKMKLLTCGKYLDVQLVFNPEKGYCYFPSIDRKYPQCLKSKQMSKSVLN
jgi:hypothetical protein